MDEDQQRAVVMLSGAALRALIDGNPGRAREHLEDIQAVLLGGASYAATYPAARPAERTDEAILVDRWST